MNSLRNRKHAGSASGTRTRAPKSNFSDQGSISRHTMSPMKTKPDEEDRLIQPNGAGPNAHVGNLADPPLYFTDNDGAGYPVYDGKNNKYVTYIERSPSTRKAAEFPGKYRPLHHPDIARAYWWQGELAFLTNFKKIYSSSDKNSSWRRLPVAAVWFIWLPSAL